MAEAKVTLVATVSVALAACAGLQPAPPAVPPTPIPSITAEELIGIWRDADTGGTGGYLQFNQDGTYRRAAAIPWLETAPFEEGKCRLEATLMTFTTSSKSKECRGQNGSYEVELTEERELIFGLVEDSCQARTNHIPGSWEWFEP
jgi:hypothetical protein